MSRNDDLELIRQGEAAMEEYEARCAEMRQREISEADDLVGVLQSGIGRAAKGEGERGDESASGVPATIPEIQNDAGTAD